MRDEEDILVAFIAKVPRRLDPEQPLYEGHIESGSAVVARGPGWNTAEQAVAWARERAPVVLIREDDEVGYESAGLEDPPWRETLPRWRER